MLRLDGGRFSDPVLPGGVFGAHWKRTSLETTGFRLAGAGWRLASRLTPRAPLLTFHVSRRTPESPTDGGRRQSTPSNREQSKTNRKPIKNMKRQQRILISTLLFLSGIAVASAQGTAFTYQGQLNDNGAPANGSYDLKFSLFDAAAAGTLVAGPLTNSATAVSSGLFTVTLDFGAGVFPGADRWLEIGVRTNGGGVFTTLSPRQEITAVPYAITAGNLTGTGRCGQHR